MFFIFVSKNETMMLTLASKCAYFIGSPFVVGNQKFSVRVRMLAIWWGCEHYVVIVQLMFKSTFEAGGNGTEMLKK